MVQQEEQGVVHSPCVSTSSALLLVTQLWLTCSLSPRGSPSKGLSLRLAEASKALLLKTGGWGRCFGVGGEFCSPSCMVLIADHMATCAVDIQKLVS